MKKKKLIKKIEALKKAHMRRADAIKKEIKANNSEEDTDINAMYVSGLRNTLRFLEKTIEELNQLLK